MVNSALQTQKLPTAIFIRGLPGSGKSYLVKALKQAFGNHFVVALDPDAIDYQSEAYREHVQAQTAEGVDPKLHAYRFLRAQAYGGITDGKLIIWDQPFTNLEIFNIMVGRLRTHAEEHGKRLPILIVEVALDPESAKARVTKRKLAGGHGPSAATLNKRIEDYKSFADEGYPTVSVRGDGEVDESVAAVMKALQDLWNQS